MKKPNICVVGASNLDLISYVPRLPKMGETLSGTAFRMGFGGKGANQAVMAGKLGGEVTIVTKLGKDIFGENTLNNFKNCGLNTQFVYFTDQAFSGVAPIAVDTNANNSIIIVTGANDLLTSDEIEQARAAIRSADVLICQLEIPTEVTLKALRVAREEGVKTILNPAPGQPGLPQQFYELSDIFCPNESESELLAGFPIKTLDDAERAGRCFIERGAGTCIITLGENGSLLVTSSQAIHVPAVKVQAVDTTGAGDAFVGSFAYFLAAGDPFMNAMDKANRVAGISVQSSGTQSSFPTRADLPVTFFE